MSRPRHVLAGQFYMVTRRCAQRMFLLHPDSATRNAFLYCLAIAAKLVGIEIIATCAMSNHHHTIIFDRLGLFPKFIEHFHKLLARSQNALRRRRENFWASGQCSVVRLVDRAAVIDKIVYCLTNPVKDMLVEKVHQWPGANSYVAMRNFTKSTLNRPLHFFRNEGTMAPSVELTFAIPEELGDANEVIREIIEGVSAVEAQCAAKRRTTGARVVGVRQIKRESWTKTPSSEESRGTLSPTIACRDREMRIVALRELREFLVEYEVSRGEWLDGRRTVFPAGTYLLKRFSAPS